MSADKHELRDTFHYKGVWWLPETPEKRVHGTLFYTPQEIKLELSGGLREVDMQKLGIVEIPPSTPVIYGSAETLGQCTLFQNGESSKTMPLGGQPTSSTWESRMLFTGVHISDPLNFEYSDWTIAFDGLEEWIGVGPFRWDNTKNGQRPVEVTAHYVQPEIISVKIVSLHAQLRIDYAVNVSLSIFRSLTLEHSTFVILQPDSPKQLEWYFKSLRDIQNFFLFCIGEPVFPKMITAHVLSQEQEEEESPRKEISVYFRVPHIREQERLSPALMPMPLRSIRHMLPEMLNHWFSKGEKLQDAYNLFFSTIYNTESFVQSVFLSLTQALETYSRAVHDALYLPSAEYEKVSVALNSAIPSDTPQDLKVSLKSRIRFGNEYSLRKRLMMIMNSLEEKTTKLICDDTARFIARIVDTRNYLTHYTEELREKAVKNNDLQFANYRMQLLLTILLCKEMGVNETSIRSVLMSNSKWLQLIHLHLAKGS
jgi:hypothetical protein